MLSARLGAGSLAASLTGLLALTGDVINIAASLDAAPSSLSTVLEPVFSAANLTGLLLGLLFSRANRCRYGTVGLHLSRAPTVVALMRVMARASQSASWALESTSEAKVRPGQERGLQEAVVALDHALVFGVPRWSELIRVARVPANAAGVETRPVARSRIPGSHDSVLVTGRPRRSAPTSRPECPRPASTASSSRS